MSDRIGIRLWTPEKPTRSPASGPPVEQLPDPSSLARGEPAHAAEAKKPSKPKTRARKAKKARGTRIRPCRRAAAAVARNSERKSDRPHLIPQPGGRGALLSGGLPGNAGGGRPASDLRARMRGSLAERIAIAESIADSPIARDAD